jgi:D-3-phosphoglycerate dehydrogenase
MVTKKTAGLSIFAGPKPWKELLATARDFGKIVDKPQDADAIMWFGRDPQQIVGRWSSKLQWLQLPDAGIEKWLVPEVLDGDFVTTSAAGAYGSQVAEHALALILAGRHELVRAARATYWDPDNLHVRTLDAMSILIIGAGGIGSRLGFLLHNVGCSVEYATRHERLVSPDTFSIAVEDLYRRLADFDVVVLACPSTSDTRGMVNHAFLRQMKSEASLINVARGDLVVTKDLTSALENDEIRFAGLDVTDPEPLPPDHRLFTLENCLVTPHVANPPSAKRASFVRLVRDNLELFVQGKKMHGLIGKNIGY